MPVRSSSVCVCLLAVVVTASVLAAPPDEPVDPAQANVVCQQSLLRSARGALGGALGELERCLAKLARCGGADPACVARAGARCERDIAARAARERALAGRVAGGCEAPPFEAADVLGDLGIGFGRHGEACAQTYGVALDGAETAGACLVRQHRCLAERLLGFAGPVARAELIAAGLAPEALAALGCLVDRGAEIGTAGRSRPVAGCASRIRMAAARFARGRAEGLGRCAATAFACEQLRPGDPACLARAEARCRRESRRSARLAHRIDRALARCHRLPFAELAGPQGLGLAALAGECATLGTPAPVSVWDYGDCLRRQHECLAADLAAFAVPRVGELLDLLGIALTDDACAGLDPTPTASTTPTPTPVATGPDGSTPIPPTPTPTRTPTRTPTPTATPTPICGDGEIDGDEECDGADLDDNTCEDLCDQDDEGGTLRCNPDCTYDFSGCPGTDCEP